MNDTGNEYTPPTATVRYAYSMHSFGPQSKTNPEFDRWLAAHDREVAAQAWDEGRESVALDLIKPLGDDGQREVTHNPYRIGDSA